MHLKITSAILASLLLSGCDPSTYKAIDQLEFQSTGHAAVPDALLAQNQPVEAVSSSSASSEPVVVVTPSSSSSEYVAPVTETCLPGEHVTRLWDCDSTGHRAYW